jgi:hypothetical protein
MPISDRYAIRPETKEGIEENLSKLVQERKLNRTIGKDESGLSALLNSYRAQADKTLEENKDVQPSFGTQAMIGLLPIAAGALAGAFGPKGGRGESMALGGATGAKAGLQGLETLEKGRKERKDLREKALKSSIDIQKMQSDVSKQQQDRLESGQKIDVELGKMLSQMQDSQSKNKPQQFEWKAAGYTRDMENAMSTIERMEKKGFYRTDTRSRLESTLPNELVRAARIEQDQAERNFVNAVARPQTGAAIKPDEMEDYKKMFFPRPGDSAQDIENKRALRQQRYESTKAEAGNALDMIPSIPIQTAPMPKQEQQRQTTKEDAVKAIQGMTPEQRRKKAKELGLIK